jgi:hypothetical protein
VSTASATSPTPATVSISMPGDTPIGAAYWLMSARPAEASLPRWSTDPDVGMTPSRASSLP